VDDARLTLTTAKAAHIHGALLANYARVVGLLKAGGRVVGAQVIDERTGREIEVRARVVINASGVWVDEVCALDEHSKSQMTRPTKGIHLVIPRARLTSQHAVAFDVPRDGRHVFLIPWGDFALIGTTDTDYDGPLDAPAATREDVEYLLEGVQHTFPGTQMTPDDVISTFAGLRPLLFAEGGSYALSREHEIVESPSGLITIAGGKLTTHRLMARQLTDRAEKRLAEEFGLHQQHDCRTKEPLSGAQFSQAPLSDQDERVSRHLLETYGSDAAWVVGCAEGNPALGEPIVPGLPYLMAEVAYAVQHEMALTLADALVRRTHVIYEVRDGGLARAPAVANLMAERLGWDQAERTHQMAEYEQQVKLTQAWRKE